MGGRRRTPVREGLAEILALCSNYAKGGGLTYLKAPFDCCRESRL